MYHHPPPCPSLQQQNLKPRELGYLVLHFSPWRRQTKLEAKRQEVESSVPHFSLDGRQQCLTLGRETNI